MTRCVCHVSSVSGANGGVPSLVRPVLFVYFVDLRQLACHSVYACSHCRTRFLRKRKASSRSWVPSGRTVGGCTAWRRTRCDTVAYYYCGAAVDNRGDSSRISDRSSHNGDGSSRSSDRSSHNGDGSSRILTAVAAVVTAVAALIMVVATIHGAREKKPGNSKTATKGRRWCWLGRSLASCHSSVCSSHYIGASG